MAGDRFFQADRSNRQRILIGQKAKYTSTISNFQRDAALTIANHNSSDTHFGDCRLRLETETTHNPVLEFVHNAGYGFTTSAIYTNNVGTLHFMANSTVIATGSNTTFNIQGTLTKSSGAFRIPHPMDPEKKTLYHSFVEAPRCENIYSGQALGAV